MSSFRGPLRRPPTDATESGHRSGGELVSEYVVMERRNVELTREIHALRAQLGLEIEAESIRRLASAFGLSVTQARIVLLLHNRRGRIVSWSLLDAWLTSRDLPAGSGADLRRQHLNAIRRRLGPDATESIRGLGVRLEPRWVARLDTVIDQPS
jgi:hypothetical protein